SALHLTATPDASSLFTGWSGACSGTGACNVTMNGDENVTATFGPRAKFRPDLLLKGASGGYLGDNVYNGTGAGQTVSAKGARGTKKVFYFYLQNDGATADVMTLTAGGASPGFK